MERLNSITSLQELSSEELFEVEGGLFGPVVDTTVALYGTWCCLKAVAYGLGYVVGTLTD